MTRLTDRRREDVPRASLSVRTLGFEPICEHGDGTARGVVLDPFTGAGTTLLVADRLGRDAIGIELNPEYAEMARERIRGDAPLLALLNEEEAA